MSKVCTKCGVEQPDTNFSKKCNTPDGLRYDCKACNSAQNKTYKEAHREKTNECKKQYRVKHRERNIEYSKRYSAEHKEQKRERMKQYYVKNSEALLRKGKAWRDSNKDKKRKTCATWKTNNPEAAKVHGQTRRARKAGLARTLTPAQWKHILDGFNNTCAYCGVGDKTLHQEHFIPLSLGGEYTHDNIIPACSHCNFSKGPKSFWEWYPTSGYYDKQREKKIMKFLHYTGESQQLTLCT